jgi:hypothetical protein
MQQPSNEQQIEMLRERERRGEPMDAVQQAQLVAFYQRIEATEAGYLSSATEHLRQKVQEQEERIRRLETLRTEKQLRLSRIQSLVREMQAIEAEEIQLLSAAKA